MLLFHRRRQQRSFDVPVETAWAALTAALPYATGEARFYRQAHRVEWAMEPTGFDWGQQMRATVEQAAAGGSLVTVTGDSRPARRSALGPSRRAKAATAIFAAMSDMVRQPIGAVGAEGAEDGV